MVSLHTACGGEGELIGTVLPVSAKKEMYGPGAGYHVRSLRS